MDDNGQPAADQATGDPEADLEQAFKTAFARNFAAAGQAPGSRVRLTVAELADLAERMFLAGFSAAIDEICR